MAESRNFKELLLLLNECLVEYLIVGGCAVMRYSEPRFTKDLDIWVGNSRQTFRRVFVCRRFAWDVRRASRPLLKNAGHGETMACPTLSDLTY
jgi:hypothetical protein